MTVDNGRLVEKISLSNGLVLEAWDFSRHTAGDRCQVVFVCRIAVELKLDYFPSTPEGEAMCGELERAFGRTLFFEYTSKRNFIAEDDREKVWRELLEYFKQDSLRYVSHPQFAKRYVLSRYRELKKNPYQSSLIYSHPIFDRIQS